MMGPSRTPARPILALLAVIISAWATGTLGFAGEDATPRPKPATTPQNAAKAEMTIPLRRGRLMLRDLLRAMYDELELQPPQAIDDVHGSIDPQTLFGRNRIESLRTLTEGVLAAEINAEHVVITFDRPALMAKLNRSRVSPERWMQDFSRILVWWNRRATGLTFVTDENDRTPLAVYQGMRDEMPRRVVVLIHGLDDPGWMFDDVAPTLRRAGFETARIEYPNDGPIGQSADLAALCLMELKRRGVEKVDIVAHSMGGLVARDVLTRTAYYSGDGAGNQRFPAVDRLVMCGTPNHGSNMARLRAVSEAKEHMSRTLSGQGTWFGGFLDGRGEAATELLPGSAFLRQLNERPIASHTACTIIAGRMSPVTGAELGALGRKARDVARAANAPNWLRNWLASADERATDVLRGAVRGLGDGCVAIDFTRLPGVDDFIVVEANHIGMIVNIVPGSTKKPPAIPIILDRLARDPPEPAPTEGGGSAPGE